MKLLHRCNDSIRTSGPCHARGCKPPDLAIFSPMNIALIGATGNVGTRLLAEALARGHTVTGIARHPEQLAPRAGVTTRAGDVGDEAGLAALLAGHDAAILSVPFAGLDIPKLLRAVKASAVPRFLVVGGAGSLEIEPGLALLDTPEFPEEYKAEANAAGAALEALRREPELNWTFLSPPRLFIPGERIGRFRLGKDQVLVDARGKSWISMEDYAIAMIDELEQPRHPRQRFTVAY